MRQENLEFCSPLVLFSFHTGPMISSALNDTLSRLTTPSFGIIVLAYYHFGLFPVKLLVMSIQQIKYYKITGQLKSELWKRMVGNEQILNKDIIEYSWM